MAHQLNDIQRRNESNAYENLTEFAVDGVVLNGVLYLKHNATSIVYASERDVSGKLVRVGTWKADTKSITLDQLPVLKSSKRESISIFNLQDDNNTADICDAAFSDVDQAVINDFLALGASHSTASDTNALFSAEITTYPFQVEDADHCETDAAAYEHIEPLLSYLCTLLKKTRAEVKIYDPYYCQGAVVKNLANLGFQNVYNHNEDFYAMIENDTVPEFDILVTNPPYSADHMETILKFCVAANKPWFLLMPNYVYCKPYYQTALVRLPAGNIPMQHVTPFYITPPYRYRYHSPVQLRQDLATKELATAPFLSFWYIDVGQHQEKLVKYYQKKYTSVSGCSLVLKLAKLPRKFQDSFDPNRKRLRKNQRDSAKRKKEMLRPVSKNH